jgi:hypothetical protein
LSSRRSTLLRAAAVVATLAFGLVLARPTFAASMIPVQYRLPFAAGQSFPINQSWHGSFSHTGTAAFAYDFGLPEGTPVVAAAAGVVAFVHDGERGCGGRSLRDDSNSVTIYHADGTATLYAHLSTVSAKVGDVVASGQEIGLSGRTGFTECGAHLHFARQAQGREVTQSIPIYFAEYGHRQLRMYEVVTSANPVCAQTATGMPTEAFCGVYTGAGSPVDPAAAPVAHVDRTVALDGGAALSVRWIGRFTFHEDGRYTFNLSSAGHVRLWIDGVLIVDGWDTDGAPATYLVPEWLTPGPHVIRLDYHSGSVPGVSLSWPAEPDARAGPVTL